MSPYPDTRPLKIKINSTDRTASIASEKIVIQDILTDVTDQASFTVKEGGGMGLAGLQTVIISSTDEATRYFGGVITRLTDRERGPFLDYDVDCEDFSWYLEHPEVLIDAEYTGQSDLAIIQAFMATCCPDIEASTYVEAVEATIDYIRFENETPRKALERLKALAGAEFYVDYGDAGHPKGHLHYFDAGTNAASFSLSDTVADPPADPYPYDNLQQIDTVPDVNSVEVVGRNNSKTYYYATDQDSKQGNLQYTTEGATITFLDDAQDFATWMEQGGVAVYQIIVTNTDDSETWAYLGAIATVDDTEQGALSYTLEGGNDTFTDDGQDFGDWDGTHRIYVTNSDSTLSWGYLGALVGATEVYIWTDAARTVRGWNGVAISGKTPSSYNVVNDGIKAEIAVYQELALTTNGWNGDGISGKTPSTYKVWLADGDYGYWIRHKLVDNDLITITQLRNRGLQYLTDVAAGVGYTCTIEQPGLSSGQDVTLVNALRSINTSFMIRRVTTRFTTGGYAEYDLELGARKRRIGDVLVAGRNIWDEEKFLPKRPGLIEQEDAGTDVQAQHDLFTYNDQVGEPSVINLKKSHSDTLGTLTPTIDTEELGEIAAWGVESGSTGFKAATFKAVQRGAAGASSIDVEWQTDSPIAFMGGEEARFYDVGSSNYVGFEAPALAADQIWVLPDADGNANEVLGTDAGGNLIWRSAGEIADGVAGPASSTDNAIARWDGVGGDTIQDSGVLIDDTGNLQIRSGNELRFYDNGNYVGFEAPALAADKIWVLPDADGAVGDYLKTDGGGNLSWDSPPGGGDVVGPGAATDNAIARWDGAGGALLQDSGVLIDDSNKLTTPGTIELDFASGDPVIIFDTDGADKFALGVDDSDGDKFKIDAGGALGDYADFELASGAQAELISGGTNTRPNLILSAYNDQSSGGDGYGYEPRLILRKSHTDTLGSLVASVALEELGRIRFMGVNTSAAWDSGASIGAVVWGDPTASDVPTRLWLHSKYIELETETGGNIFLEGNTEVSANLNVVGTLTKGGGSFKIDHPLYPDTHWLYHSMVESPEMLNLYDGLIELDKNGMAWVTLPDWFMALNRDYRYQLTPVGTAMTMLHIGGEIEGNRFLIAGGRPNSLVSWQVTGIRQDRFANENRIQVEVRKTDD